MYCIKCGVRLADTEKECPLCGTVPFHPEITREEAAPLYPRDRYPERRVGRGEPHGCRDHPVPDPAADRGGM